MTSVRAAHVTAARRLAKRTFRAHHRSFLAEGPQAVREALAASEVVRELFVTGPATERFPELLAAAEAAGAAVHRVSGEVFAALAQTVTPQGIAAVCRFVDVSFTDLLAADLWLVVVLAQVRDPGNAGTVVRCADAAGADAVVVTDASVDVYNPKCVRAAAGSLFHLPFAVQVPVAECVEALRGKGLAVLAADGDGPVELPDAVADGTLSGRVAWLFGNEAWGLPARTRELADASVRVPVYGRAESLNLATAAAVCLYASATSQRTPRSVPK